MHYINKTIVADLGFGIYSVAFTR